MERRKYTPTNDEGGTARRTCRGWNRPSHLLRIGKFGAGRGRVPSAGDPISGDDNFSFKNFDWLAFQDRMNQVTNSAETLAIDASPQLLEGLDPAMTRIAELKMVPLALDLPDGSQTIAFRMPAEDAATFAAMSSSSNPEDVARAQKLLFTKSDKIITTPDRNDRLRGVPSTCFVVRTPSSLVDLLDDEVPDLREGLFLGGDPSREHAPLVGGLPAIAVGAALSFYWDVAQKIYENISDQYKSGLSLSKLVETMGKLALNLVPGVPLYRVISGIASGDLNRFLDGHRDLDLYDAICAWLAQVAMGDSAISQTTTPTPPVQHDPMQEPDGPTIERPGGGADHHEQDRWCGVSPNNWLNSSDDDVAVVPISYWRRLYAMGSCFRKRNRIPNFSNLMFSGSPTTDLLTFRVPSIYIKPNGQITNEFQKYVTAPMAGGLFKKIKNAVKKVGGAVKKVAQTVAKGVSKVMDSPLGNVIKAIPGVGTVASIAQGAAKVVTKVTGAIDKVKSKVADIKAKVASSTSDDKTNGASSQAGGMATGPETGEESASADYISPTANVGLKETSGGGVNISALPKWAAVEDKPYYAPPLSLLTGSIPGIEEDKTGGLLISNDAIPSDLEMLQAQVAAKLAQLRDYSSELDYKGPLLMARLKGSGPYIVAGGPVRSTQVSLTRRSSSYWRPHSLTTRLRRVPVRLAGDPDLDKQLIALALAKFEPMAQWTGVPALASDFENTNPFVATYFIANSDKGTRSLMNNGIPHPNALKSYVFECPVISRIEARQQDVCQVIQAAIVWALYLMSCKGLGESQRSQMAALMQQATQAGCFTDKGLDELLRLTVKAEWLPPENTLDKTSSVTWTRMLAASILYAWYEAGVESTNDFTRAICAVSQPSADAVRIMNGSLSDGSGSVKAGNDDKKMPITSGASQLPTRADSGPSILDKVLRLGDGPSPTEEESWNPIRDDTRPFSDEIGGAVGPGGWPEEADAWLNSRACDWQMLAESICRRCSDSEGARIQMLMNHIPSFIISLALQKFFPSIDASCAPMSLIPFTRKDYLCEMS
jgi:hypothetical protein